VQTEEPTPGPRQVNLRRLLPLTALYLVTLALAGIQVGVALHEDLGTDAHAYWHVWRAPMYSTGPMTRDAYLYSPAFAQAIWPLTLIPWFTVFALLVAMGNGVLLLWLLRPLGWLWAVPLTVFLLPELVNGNIFIPLAAMAVLGFRYPGVWAFSALTKVAPTVMPVWWLARREWRPLLVFVGTTAVVATVSAVLAPHLWVEWMSHLVRWATTESQQRLGIAGFLPLAYRAPAGIVLVIIGARRDWRWSVPVAALLCTPVVWLGSYAWLAAIPRIRTQDASQKSVRSDSAWPSERVAG